MDYLLLSYVIYHKGFAAPHVAGGVNLNLPVIGRFLRKGGAFFLRRSFKGDALYAVVFAKYLGFMMARGHTLEYFIEGGRSRTGRLLSPRTGMLSMTLHAYLKDPKRPVVFMPVYFGYERIVEGRTYIGELSGQPKEKESVFGLIKATLAYCAASSAGCTSTGPAHCARRAAAAAQSGLAVQRYCRRRAPADGCDAVADLATQINIEINAAAAVTPINLVAMAISPRRARRWPKSTFGCRSSCISGCCTMHPTGLWTVTTDSGAQMIDYAEAFESWSGRSTRSATSCA